MYVDEILAALNEHSNSWHFLFLHNGVFPAASWYIEVLEDNRVKISPTQTVDP